MHTAWLDARYAVRALVRAPGFTLIAVLTLALGVGATAAIFSLVHAVLVVPLPYAEPNRVVTIWSTWVGWDKTWVSEAELLDYRTLPALRDAGAWSSGQVNLTGDGSEPERVGAAQVSPSLFDALGVAPIAGRTFTADEERAGRDAVAILGYRLWERRYGRDPGIVSRTIRVDGRALTVVGVMPPGFQLPTDYGEDFAEPTQLYTPLTVETASPERGNHGYYAAARLAPGATLEQANEQLRAITAARTREGAYPEAMRFSALAVPLDEEILGDVRPRLGLLFAAVLVLLLIACANVANLLLARAEGRVREMALRSAIGAGHGRLARQVVTESVVLALAGAAVGIGLAFATVRVVTAFAPGSIPRLASASVNGTVLLFTLGSTLLTALLFSLAPLARLHGLDMVEALKEGGHGATVGAARHRARQALVTAQVALAVVLLVCAGLAIRSLWALHRVDLGFSPDRVLTLQLALPEQSYPDPEHVAAFYDRLVERLREVPGVAAAGAVRSLPLAATIGDWGLDVEGYVEAPGRNAKGDWQVVTPGALEALGERLVAGRAFTTRDRADSLQVAIVNETMARTYWADGNPIGRRIRMGSDPARPWITVVGIVRDVRHNGIVAGVKEKFYRPHAQFHVGTDGVSPRNMTVVVKAAGDPRPLARPIRDVVASLDRNLPISAVRPMTEVVSASMAGSTFTGLLLGGFAALALVLAAIGIYGVLSYVVSQRTREIGIRVAVGASAGDVLRLVLRQGLLLTGAGLGAGIALALAATQVMSALLYGVQPRDLATFVAVPVLLAVVGLVASAVPAARAARVNPIEALRTE